MINLSRRTLMSVAALAALAPAANSAFALDPAKNTKDMPMRNQKFALTREETLDVIRRTDHAVLSLADGTGEPYGVPITPILLDGKIYFHGAGMGDDTHFGIFGVTHCNFQRRFRRGGCGDGPQKQCRQYKGKHLLVAHECSPLSWLDCEKKPIVDTSTENN